MADDIQQETHGSPLPLVNHLPASKMLESTRARPKGRWSIKNVQTACNQLDLSFRAPTRGSHYKVSSPCYVERIETIPYNKPIKPFYIKAFIEFADAHIRACEKTENEQ